MFAHNEKSKTVFDVVNDIGKAELFNEAMSGSSALCAQETVTTYPFGELEVHGEDSAVLVDVGGSQGDTLKQIRDAFPDLKGKMILEDLQSVLDGGVVEGFDAEIQAYDFFKEDQPIKGMLNRCMHKVSLTDSFQGASAYFYQRIFHDWNDEDCKSILKSLKPAMEPHSKLLICDVVVPDQQPSPLKVLRDINMLLIGGRERGEREWKDLLSGEGFSIEKIHGLYNTNNSIIEASLPQNS